MQALRAVKEYKWLKKLGVSDYDAMRALRLARRSTIVRLSGEEAVIAVPSQRLGLLSPEKTVTHRDLVDLLKGSSAKLVATKVGRLPEDQQLYLVHVRRDGAECPCPATRLAHDPLCIHKLAAAIVLYQRGRLDLLKWLPRAIQEKKAWRAYWRRRTKAHSDTVALHP